MIKLKTLLNEKYLGFGTGAGKVKEGFKDYLGYSGDASATDLAQGLDRDPMTGNLNIKQTEVQLDQLEFDEIVKLFSPKDHFNDVHYTRMQPNGQEGPFYRDGLNFPNPSDASSVVGDMKSFQQWKEKTKSRFGNVKVILDPEAKEHWEKVQIDDDKFAQDKQQASDAKASMLKQWGTTT
jgi:hypothetical protein